MNENENSNERNARQLAAIGFVIADERAESDTCECGTAGCCVDHAATPFASPCQTW